MSADPYRIDSHKLLFHPRRVADWLEGKNIAPIYMEVSPSGACNHRCVFCGMDFLGYQTRFLPSDAFIARLAGWAEAGLKAIMFAGEGEPFLHKDITHIAQKTKEAGIDVSFTTNAVALTPQKIEEILPVTSWIKVSCNAGTQETYATIHGTQAQDFTKVLHNLTEATRLRSQLDISCTIGIQMLLLPENQHEAITLAKHAQEIGLDYLVIKPYSIHRQSQKTQYTDLQYGDCSQLAYDLEAMQTDSFKVIFRHQALQRKENLLQTYSHCYALPFWGYVDATGQLWGCIRHIGEQTFAYGNILDCSAREVLDGIQRTSAITFAAQRLDIQDCHVDCRMDTINAYLWELKHPHGHVNFV